MARYSMATGARAMDAHREDEEGEVCFTPPPKLDRDLEGESGNAEAAWERRDGKIYITSINGVSLDGEGSDEDEAEEPHEGDESEETGEEEGNGELGSV